MDLERLVSRIPRMAYEVLKLERQNRLTAVSGYGAKVVTGCLMLSFLKLYYSQGGEKNRTRRKRKTEHRDPSHPSFTEKVADSHSTDYVNSIIVTPTKKDD